jgi:hypothetical protein
MPRILVISDADDETARPIVATSDPAVIRAAMRELERRSLPSTDEPAPRKASA